MIYSPLINRVIAFVYDAHFGQTDKSGVPYFCHPYHVAEQMDDEDSTVLALLHDVVEDTGKTYEEVAALGVSEKVIAALRLLTHDPDEPYMDYIAKLKASPLAVKVKLADIEHNSDVTRYAPVTENDRSRQAKYAKAKKILLEN